MIDMAKERFYVRKLRSNYFCIMRGNCQIAHAKTKQGAYDRIKKLKNGTDKGGRLW